MATAGRAVIRLLEEGAKELVVQSDAVDVQDAAAGESYLRLISHGVLLLLLPARPTRPLSCCVFVVLRTQHRKNGFDVARRP